MVCATSVSPMLMAMRIGGLTVCPFSAELSGLALGKPCNALGESVLLNEPGPAHSVFGLGRKCGVAAGVKIQTHNLGEAVAAHVQCLAVLQALEESKLLFVHLEQLGIA